MNNYPSPVRSPKPYPTPAVDTSRKLAALRVAVARTLTQWAGRHADAAWYRELEEAYKASK